MYNQYNYIGVVYKYTLKEDCPQNGWVYIGETKNEKKRRYDWQESKSKYGGKSITSARNTFGISDNTWDYEVIEYVYSDSPENLKIDLVNREKHHIAQYKNYNVSLFNGNKGGKGRG